MSVSSSSRGFSPLAFIAALAICMAFVRTESVADSSPPLHKDNQDTLSGAGAIDVTTKVPYQELTENPYDYEESTHAATLEEEVVLGPGAITAIVIAVFLGASVLLALIVITLRKFTAS